MSTAAGKASVEKWYLQVPLLFAAGRAFEQVKTHRIS